MKPAVYIPNLNGCQRLDRTLECLGPAKDFTLVVIDDGSTDDSLAMLSERHPDVRVIVMGENAGYGRALNRAVEEVLGDPLIFINNDVECEPGFVEALLDGHSKGAAMVAGVLLQKDQRDLIDSAGIVVEGDTLMAFDYLHGENVTALEDAPPPLGPTGGAALFERDAFRRVGGFDERIFGYYEDVDLALRLRSAGYECALAPQARGQHEFSATLGPRSGAKYALTGWSRGYLLGRYGVLARPGPAARAFICEAAVCGGQIIRDRTLRGLRGRLSGWRASQSLSRRPVPDVEFLDLPLRERLLLRSKRRRS